MVCFCVWDGVLRFKEMSASLEMVESFEILKPKSTLVNLFTGNNFGNGTVYRRQPFESFVKKN